MTKPTQHIMAVFCNRGSLMVAAVYVFKSYTFKCDDKSSRTQESASVCHFHHVLRLQVRVSAVIKEHSEFLLL